MGPGSSMQRERSLRASNACPRAAPETTPLWTLFLIQLSLTPSSHSPLRTLSSRLNHEPMPVAHRPGQVGPGCGHERRRAIVAEGLCIAKEAKGRGGLRDGRGGRGRDAGRRCACGQRLHGGGAAAGARSRRRVARVRGGGRRTEEVCIAHRTRQAATRSCSAGKRRLAPPHRRSRFVRSKSA